MKGKEILSGKGCRYRDWNKDCILTGDHHGDNTQPCEFIDEKNCYYKQLKRKTEECELMEIAIKIKDQRNEDYSKALTDKSKKCEELKEENKDLKDLNNRLDNMRETYYKEYLKLDNKLNEIYKIANTLITLTNEYDNCYHKDRCNKCKDRKECQYYQVEKILNIINKVKGGDNE